MTARKQTEFDDDFKFTILKDDSLKYPVYARISKINKDLFAKYYKGMYSHQYIKIDAFDIKKLKLDQRWCPPDKGESYCHGIIIKNQRMVNKNLILYHNNNPHLTFPKKKKGDNENENVGNIMWIDAKQMTPNYQFDQYPLLFKDKGQDCDIEGINVWNFLNKYYRETNQYVIWYFGTWIDTYQVSVFQIENQPEMPDGLIYLIRDTNAKRIKFVRYAFNSSI